MRIAILTMLSIWALTRCALCGPTTRAGDPPDSGLVGRFGDLRQIKIEGCRQIAEADVRSALKHDVSLQVVSGPSAPIDQFISTLKIDLQAAYLSSGFAFAKVDVRLDERGNPQAIVVEEGKRYGRGEIRVEGAKSLPVEQLRQRLAQARHNRFKTELDARRGTIRVAQLDTEDSDDKPIWKIGAPAAFDPISRAALDKPIARSMAALGYFRCTFTTDLLPAQDDRADLIIRISDDGPRATLAAIEVRGAQLNSSQEVLAFLDLHKGQPIDLQQLEAAQSQLWESGRFKRHVLSLQSDEQGSGSMRLLIELTEHPALPKLLEPLCEADQIILKTGRWLEKLPKSHVDLILQGETETANISGALSLTHGLAMKYLRKADAGRAVNVIATALGVSICDSASHSVQSMSLPRGTATIQFTLVPTFDVGPDAKWERCELGAGVHSGERDNGAIKTTIVCAPVGLLDEMHQSDVRTSINEGLMTVTYGEAKAHIEAMTGRIIDISGLQGKITFENGGFARLAAKLKSDTSATNKASSSQPLPELAIESAFRALAPNIGPLNDLSEEKRNRAIPPLAKLTIAAFDGLTQYLDAHVGPPSSDDQEFLVPPNVEALSRVGLLGVAAAFSNTFADDLAPRGSWLWTVWRENCLMFAQVRGSAGREMARLLKDDQVGPLAAVVMSYAPLGWDPDFRKNFARAGLRNLNAGAMAEDVAAFVDGDTCTARVSAALISELRKMKPDEIDALGELFPAKYRDAAVALLQAVRIAPVPWPKQVLQIAVLRTWDQHLRPMLETSLEMLIERPRRDDGRL